MGKHIKMRRERELKRRINRWIAFIAAGMLVYASFTIYQSRVHATSPPTSPQGVRIVDVKP